MTLRQYLHLAVLGVAIAPAACSDGGRKAGPPDPVVPATLERSGDPGDPATRLTLATPIRRLTRDEYLNSVADSLGLDARSHAKLLSEDIAADGFRNNVLGHQPSVVRSEGYASMAEWVASAAPWGDATTRGLRDFAPCQAFEDPCEQGFVSSLGRLLFRRPLIPDEVANHRRLFRAAQTETLPFEAAARLVLEALLQSPNFLFVIETISPSSANPQPGLRLADPFELASRLSFLIWKSGPDLGLLDRAERGALATAAAVQDTLTAMLADPRARRGVRAFAEDWLALYSLDGRVLDRSLFDLPADVYQQMKAEPLALFERLALAEERPLPELFSESKTTLTPAVAALYGLPAADPMADPALAWREDLARNPVRIGLLTQPGVLALGGQDDHTSIVRRGLVILRTFLCRDVPDPPDAIATQFPDVPDGLTDRERFARHGADPVCAACHSHIDQLGYPFEPYDGLGRHRYTDRFGNHLRQDGVLELDGVANEYATIAGFAYLLARSPAIEACMVRKGVQYALGRSLGDDDESLVENVTTTFRKAGRRYQDLLRAIAGAPAFLAAQGADPEGDAGAVAGAAGPP